MIHSLSSYQDFHVSLVFLQKSKRLKLTFYKYSCMLDSVQVVAMKPNAE